MELDLDITKVLYIPHSFQQPFPEFHLEKKKKKKIPLALNTRLPATFRSEPSVSVGNSQLCRVADGKGYTHPEITIVISI